MADDPTATAADVAAQPRGHTGAHRDLDVEWPASQATIPIDLLAALVLAANSPAHHHRKHATWDDDGSPCRRCRSVDEARTIVGWPCHSCVECTSNPVWDLHEGQRT